MAAVYCTTSCRIAMLYYFNGNASERRELNRSKKAYTHTHICRSRVPEFILFSSVNDRYLLYLLNLHTLLSRDPSSPVCSYAFLFAFPRVYINMNVCTYSTLLLVNSPEAGWYSVLHVSPLFFFLFVIPCPAHPISLT